MNFEAEEKGNSEDALTDGGGDEITPQLWLLRSISSRAAMRMKRAQTVGTTISDATCMYLSKHSETKKISPEVSFVLKQKLKEMGHCVSNFSHLL